MFLRTFCGVELVNKHSHAFMLSLTQTKYQFNNIYIYSEKIKTLKKLFYRNILK